MISNNETSVFESDCANALQQLANMIINETSSEETKQQAAFASVFVESLLEAQAQRFHL